MKEMLYPEARKLFSPGDYLLWHGEGIISRAVRIFSADPDCGIPEDAQVAVNHVSRLWMKANHPIGPRWMQMEADAVDDGILAGDVHPRFVSEAIRKYNGYAIWCPLIPPMNRYRDRMSAWLIYYIGVGYDHGDLVKQAVMRVEPNEHDLFCSEYSEFVDRRSFGWPEHNPRKSWIFKEHPEFLKNECVQALLSDNVATQPTETYGLPWIMDRVKLLMEDA